MSVRIDNTVLVLKHIVAIDYRKEETEEVIAYVLTFNMISGLTKKFYYGNSEECEKIFAGVIRSIL